MSDPSVDEPQELSLELVTYYWKMLEQHTNSPISGICLICKVSRCADYRHAWVQLVRAGALGM